MSQPMPLTDDVFSAYLNCKYKAYLKLTSALGEPLVVTHNFQVALAV